MKYESEFGSIYGGLLTIVASLCCLAYLIILFEEMYSCKKDIIKNSRNLVTEEDEMKGLSIHEYTFVPMI